ncbi:hypothetical protein LCGC14_0885040 [marine sediment metagenome]|uniref:Cse4 family CRISPR-associated protein n=1 Tax=marine sediment metagenome TaxID=412755 RepID=A0A0F9P5S0_9ZZZZ|nr:type I-E CRISPR-associated protein Cas7/Cse4/CasC [bacterium]
MLVEIHIIQNHAPSNLNRDDTGSPKSCIFGGVRRARISSQCIKRSIRFSPMFKKAIENMGESYRTRLLPELIKKSLIEDGVSEEIAHVTAKKISELGAKKKRSDEKLITKQIMFFSSGELEALTKLFKKQIEDAENPEDAEKILSKFDFEKEMAKLGLQTITPDIALFGRMVTSEAFPDIEASIQVAHALSTNKIEHEFDYFTAVDDLISVSESIDPQGAAMIGDIEFNSACYYKYFSLDFDELIANMNVSGVKKDDLANIVVAFLSAVVYTTPSGKQNTFAAHQLPDGILIEIRDEKIPVSYTNAFIKPIVPIGGKDLIETSLEKFSGYVKDINVKYNLKSKSRLWFCTKDIQVENTTECENFAVLSENLKKNLVV